MANQVFISYRRQDGFYPAYLLYKELTDSGYTTFFDIKSIRRGDFSETIVKNIGECKDFILMVTPQTFSERIFDESDWVRQEISLALRLGKNIIPVFVNTEFPETLPDDIAAIRRYNGVKQVDANLLHESYRRIFEDFMVSSPVVEEERVVTRRCSVYDANYGDEFNRLKIQSDNAYEFDRNSLELCGAHGVVLDVGCAHGFVGKSRFAEEKYTRVVGIDKSEKCIEYAQTHKEGADKFEYAVMDVESADFVSQMNGYMSEHGIEGFDVIFAALIVLHLKSPEAAVRKLRKFLLPGGRIIIRGSDDGSKLIYPDEHGYMQKIIEKTMQVEGVSDRHNGRKIFDLLRQTGFKDVRIYSYQRDTSGIDYDARERMYRSSFSYRIDNVKKVWETDPNNREKYRKFDEMEMLLVLFENEFMKESTWFAEYDYIGIASK